MKHALVVLSAAGLLLASCAEGTFRADTAQDLTTSPPPPSAANAASVTVTATASVTASPTGSVTSAPTGSVTPAASGSASAASGGGIPADLADFFSPDPGGGPSNVVRVTNQTNQQVRSEGRLQGKTIKNDNVQPLNQAFAYASCTGCQTYAVALQIVVYRAGASTVAPKNEALAVN